MRTCILECNSIRFFIGLQPTTCMKISQFIPKYSKKRDTCEIFDIFLRFNSVIYKTGSTVYDIFLLRGTI